MRAASVRVKVLIGLLAAVVVAGGVYFLVNRDDIEHEWEVGDRFDCPSLVPELPSQRNADVVATGVESEEFVAAEQVTGINFHPESGNVYVTEKTGRVLRVPPDGGDAETVLDLTDMVLSVGNEQGLFGVAFEPDGSFMYVSYIDLDGNSAIDGYSVGGNETPSDPVELLRVEQPHMWHNGGGIFTDTDGSVWFTLGDGGLEIDRSNQGQDRTTLLGSLLRLELDDDRTTLVPAADNPFVGSDEGADEIWAYGLRNPWRAWIDDEEDRLVIADVGDNCFEEVDVIGLDEAGANFGWRRVEGPWVHDEPAPEGAIEPRFSYPRGPGACAVIGGVGTDPDVYPTLEGQYLFSDLCGSELLLLDLDGTEPARPTDIEVTGPTTVERSPDGTVYVGLFDQGVVRLVPADG